MASIFDGCSGAPMLGWAIAPDETRHHPQMANTDSTERNAPLKILAVTDFFPWPSTRGGLIRAATAVEALATLGELDLFSLCDMRLPAREVPVGVRLTRLATTAFPSLAWSRTQTAMAVLKRGVPLRIRLRSVDPQPRSDFAAFAADRYDLVWFRTPACWEWLGRPRLGPTIVDFDIIDDNVDLQRVKLHETSKTGFRASVDRVLTRARIGLSAYDWKRFRLKVAADVDQVLLCSDLDAERLGVANCAVVPNTYPEPVRPAGKAAAEDPLTVLLPGTFDYEPNVDAATWLVQQIAPALRRRLPGAKVRLAGLATPEVAALDSRPAVTVTGLVPDMADELAQADIVVVPLRMGSGTRLKILEAFAHRVPVVSTTLGAEGIDAVDGEHLLLADTVEEVVAACARFQENPELRQQVVDAAHRRYLERYTASGATARIRQLVMEVVSSTGGTR